MMNLSNESNNFFETSLTNLVSSKSKYVKEKENKEQKNCRDFLWYILPMIYMLIDRFYTSSQATHSL